MTRKVIMAVIAGMVFFSLGQVSTIQAESGFKKITLIYFDYAPRDTIGVLFFKQKYLPRVQKELAKIGYELDIPCYHNESLFKSADQVQACEAGLLDITLYSPDYNADQSPLHEILNLPLMGFDEYSATRIWFDLQKMIPELGAEPKNFKELFHLQPTGDSIGLTGLSFIMNRKKFESLPPEVRKVIDDNVLWASDRKTEIEVKNNPVYVEKCREAGNTILKLTPAEMKEWYDVAEPFHKKWVDSMEEKGLPGKKVYEEAKRLGKNIKSRMNS